MSNVFFFAKALKIIWFENGTQVAARRPPGVRRRAPFYHCVVSDHVCSVFSVCFHKVFYFMFLLFCGGFLRGPVAALSADERGMGAGGGDNSSARLSTTLPPSPDMPKASTLTQVRRTGVAHCWTASLLRNTNFVHTQRRWSLWAQDLLVRTVWAQSHPLSCRVFVPAARLLRW